MNRHKLLLGSLLLLAALIAGGCGASSSDVPPTNPPPTDSPPTDLPSTDPPTATPEPNEEPDPPTPTFISSPVPTEAPVTVEGTQVYLIAVDDQGESGDEIGCGDSVVPSGINVPASGTPLSTALETLLGLNEQFYGEDDRFYNALYLSDLQVQSAGIINGVAEIVLAGPFDFGGGCDLPRFYAQLMWTARQFDTVQDANITINGATLEVITGGIPPEGLLMFDEAEIFLIALEDAGASGVEIGCSDSAVPVEVAITPSRLPLLGALDVLLSDRSEFYGQSGLFNVFYRSNLAVESAAIQEDGTASVNLIGDLVLGGLCDNPRVAAQLEMTIRGFGVVEAVEITINGLPLDEVLSGQ